jgi:hypothetical protein
VGVPTVSSITPAIGLASGDSTVAIVGANFNTATDATAGELGECGPYVPGAPTTMQVLFGGVASPNVQVWSSTSLSALLPPGTPGPATVTLVNIDQTTGLPIGGESVAVPNGFTYQAPIHTSEYESDFTRAIKTLLSLFSTQLGIDVSLAVNTDYDATTGDELHVTQFAKLPGLVFVGPTTRENRFYSTNQQPTFDDGTISDEDGVSPAGFLETRVPYTIDIVFEVYGVSDTKGEVFNLESNFVMAMHRNKWLVMNRSATDPTKGSVRYEMDFEPQGQPKNTTVPNNSNIRAWMASIVVRGFNIEAFSGLTADGTSDPSQLIPAHAVIDHGHNADLVTLDVVPPSS